MQEKLGRWRLLGILSEHDGERFVRAQDDAGRCILRYRNDTDPAMHWQDRCRFEINLIAQVDAEGILRPVELVEHDGLCLLAYRDFAGHSLMQWLKGNTADLETVLELALRTLDVLRALHAGTLVYANLCPQNLLFDPQSGDIRLLDFSHTLQYRQDAAGIRLPTGPGRLACISPEQSGRTNLQMDYRSDFYSLGVLCYRLLGGRFPFYSEDPNHLIYQHLATIPEPLSALNAAVPEVLDQIVLKLLAKSPADRYQSHAGLERDLRHCLSALRRQESVSTFEIARIDIDATFNLPQRLYGRDTELKRLLAEFDRAAAGETGLVMVAGYSGIGKSRVIKELYKPINARNGFFIEGKFDQYRRDIPYSALIQALSGLTDYILTLTGDRFDYWQRRLSAELHASAAVIAEIMPRIQLVIGDQPDLPLLSAPETEQRLKQAFAHLVTAFAGEAHPLVIFLDDLQWADAPSLSLLQSLLGGDRGRHLLVIGAYRNNEVDSAHPVSRMRYQLKEQGRPALELTLEPLGRTDATAFVADTLRLEPSDVTALADTLYDKTLGNPFFLSRYLTQLHEEGSIFFDGALGRWSWDERQIGSMSLADNVVDLMGRKIERYPQATRRLLMMASHLGAQFNLATLAAVADLGLEESLTALQPVLNDGLLLAVDDHYKYLSNGARFKQARFRFLHDRIQQAAHNDTLGQDIAGIKLHIGRTLLALNPQPDRDSLFEIAEQINGGGGLVTDPEEKLRFAELNLRVGLLAKRSSAYLPACRFLNAGRLFLGEDLLARQPALGLDLYRELAECSYLAGEFAWADSLYPILKSLAKDPLEVIRCLSVQVNQYQLQGRFQEALAVIDQGIVLVGIRFPEPGPERAALLDNEYRYLEERCRTRQDGWIPTLPEMTDPLLVAAMELLRVQWYASYLVGDAELNSLVSLTLSRLSLERGNCDVSPFGYVTSALVAGLVKNNPMLARFLGEQALTLADARGNRSIRGTTYLLYTTFTHHWHHPVQSSEALFATAWECSEAASDYVTAGYVINVRSTDLLIAGYPLQALETRYLQEIEYLKKTKQKDMEDATFAGGLQPVRALLGKTADPGCFDDEGFSEQRFLDTYAETGLHQAYFYQARIRHAFIMQTPDLAQVAEHYSIVEQYVPGQCKVSEACFYAALAFLHLADSAAGESSDYYRRASALHDRFLQWEQYSTANFRHKRLLIEAELCRVSGRHIEAGRCYEQAIQLAGNSGFSNCAAVACERYAHFLVGLELMQSARLYIKQAGQWYSRWGAVAKLKALKRAWPDVRFDAIDRADEQDSSLDLQAIFKAANVLSGKTRRDELAETLLQIVNEYSGATYGALVYVDEGGLSLLACAGSDDEPVNTFAPGESGLDSVAAQQRLPVNLVNYVHKTYAGRVFNSPAEWEGLGDSVYLRERAPLSIVCHPIIGRSGLIAILYLENRLTTHAFNADKLEAVSLISQQAATSIENAELYENMESRIELRTRELAEAKARAEEAAEAKASFVARMSHEIRTPINAVIGLSRLGLKTGPDEQQQDYLNKILDSGEVLLGLVNDILDFSKIEAGKLVLEKTRFSPEKLVQRAIGMSALKAHAKGLELVSDIEPSLPSVLLGDPLRLQQILVNLVSNAVKFTEQGFVCVRLRCRRLADAQVELHCTVQDTGIGISPEQQTLLFQSFSQADDSVTRKYGGTGLGLAITRQLCEMMGGEIRVESEPGKGAAFIFTLALEAGDDPSPRLFIDRARVAGLKTLVVDDIELARRVLVDLLHSLDIHADQAGNGQEAVARVSSAWEQGTPYDLILMDWRMPGMDGIEAACRIRQAYGEAAPTILMVSAYDRQAAQEQSGGNAIGQFIEKPVSPSTLVDAIEGMLAEHPDASTRAPSGDEAVPDLSRYRLLLVEDNAINCQVALGYLEDTGVAVDTAENGLVALDRLRQRPYDLVLMDIQMPEMDGLTAARHVREQLQLKELPIIAMTAHVMEAARQQSVAAGMNDHISKPVEPAVLYQMLQKYLQGGTRQAISAGEGELSGLSGEQQALLAQLSALSWLDVPRAVRNLGGKAGLYLELVDSFQRKCRQLGTEINRLRAADEREELARVIHSLKSSSAYIGAFALSGHCADLERALQGGEDIGDLTPVCDDLEGLLSRLQALWSGQMKEPSAVAFSEAVLREALRSVQPLLATSDFGVEEHLESLQQMVVGTEYADRIAALVTHVDDIEYEKAAELAVRLLRKLSHD